MNAQALLHAPRRTVLMVNGRPCTATGAVLITDSPFPKAELTPDDELLQAALLEPRTATRPPLLQRLAGELWRWC